jgi:hypothetical protein
MTKNIADFREEDYGLFIDLASHAGRIGVDRSTGDILLDEGNGDDCYHGAAIDARSFRRFELKPDEKGSCEIVLHFGEKGAHGLGRTQNTEAARSWVHNATTVIKQHVPIRAAPELQPEVAIFSDAVRVMHPPASYGAFQRRPELTQLSDWARGDKRVCVVRGGSGSGKSTLATHFMLSACPGSIAGYRDARTPFESAFYFSFYDDPRPTSFWRALAHWLRLDALSSLSSVSRVLRMLLSAGPKLIVLDGIEAVQCRDRHSTVKKLVDAIGKSTKGGVRLLVTTRDDKLFVENRFIEFIALERLPQDIAIALLRSRGVDGDEQILQEFARALDYHPISLDMAGHCIREFGWQKNWSAYLTPTSAGREIGVSLAILNFETVVREFVDRLTEAAPPATELLSKLHKVTTQGTSDSIPPSSQLWQKHEDIMSWCLNVLTRANVVTSFVERDGYVGAASGGSARYQFEPEVRLGRHAHEKVMLQSSRINVDVEDKTEDRLRERVAGWLPAFLAGKKAKRASL